MTLVHGSCPKRKEWNRTHDKVAEAIHWELAGKRRFERNERWYDHVRRKVCLKMTTTNLGGTSVFEQTMKLGPRRLDLVVIDKRHKSCQIIHVAIPEDGRVREMRKLKST